MESVLTWIEKNNFRPRDSACLGLGSYSFFLVTLYIMQNFIPIICGIALGVITWKFSPYSADFGLGPLIWILICAVGGWYTWGR